MALSFPNIDPIALQLGPLAIRWYALAYILGIVLGWVFGAWQDKTRRHVLEDDWQLKLDNFVTQRDRARSQSFDQLR